jgi:hypothetical protein
MIQELHALNVRVSVITEDNISHIENMGFSKNIDKLVYSGASMTDLIEETNANINQIKKENVDMGYLDRDYKLFEPERRMPEKEIQENKPEQEEEIQAVWSIATPTENIIRGDNNSPVPMFDNINYGGQALAAVQAQEAVQAQALAEVQAGSETQSGGTIEDKPLELGEIVHRRGDNKPSRIWKIQNIGKQFHTIDTEDSEGLPISEMVQVVNPFEIYRPGDYNYVPIIMEEMPPVYEDPIMTDFLSKEQQKTDESKINFAPVIKIFTDGGNDMSVSQPLTESASDKGPIVMKGGSDSVRTSSSVIQETNNSTSSNTNDSATTAGGIDFNKGLFIVKKE